MDIMLKTYTVCVCAGPFFADARHVHARGMSMPSRNYGNVISYFYMHACIRRMHMI